MYIHIHLFQTRESVERVDEIKKKSRRPTDNIGRKLYIYKYLSNIYNYHSVIVYASVSLHVNRLDYLDTGIVTIYFFIIAAAAEICLIIYLISRLKSRSSHVGKQYQ